MNNEEREIRDMMTKKDLFNMVIIATDIQCLVDVLHKLNIETIAVYGMGMVGKGLVKLLDGTNITVKYGADKNVRGEWNGICIYGMDEIRNDIDAIIVTPTYYFDDIKEELMKMIRVPILDVGNLLNEALLYSQVRKDYI